MSKYVRFADLKARGIVNNWASLKYRIDNFGFPRGRLIGPNTRAWTEEEIDKHLADRPTAPKPVPRRDREAETT